MSTQRYSVTPHPIETLLTWVKSGEIAIPEIQRPFVWDATKVRNLLDSLYQGYPVGYLIAWLNPTVKLKDGTPSAGKRILIAGQQRVTALMAALLASTTTSGRARPHPGSVVTPSPARTPQGASADSTPGRHGRLAIMAMYAALKTPKAAGTDKALALAVVDVAQGATADHGRELY